MGHEINLPLDAMTTLPQGECDPLSTDYVQDLHNKIIASHDRARRNIKVSLQRQKCNYDRHVTSYKIQQGPYVWLRNTLRKKGLSPKLQMRWTGPYRVLNKLSAVTFRIQRTPHSKQKVINYDKLKVYEGPPIARLKCKRPPDDTDHNFNDQHTRIEPESIPVKRGERDRGSQDNDNCVQSKQN